MWNRRPPVADRQLTIRRRRTPPPGSSRRRRFAPGSRRESAFRRGARPAEGRRRIGASCTGHTHVPERASPASTGSRYVQLKHDVASHPGHRRTRRDRMRHLSSAAASSTPPLSLTRLVCTSRLLTILPMPTPISRRMNKNSESFQKSLVQENYRIDSLHLNENETRRHWRRVSFSS